jgi:hypothetical protein
MAILLLIQGRLLHRQRKAYDLLVLALVERVAELQREQGNPNPDTIILKPSAKSLNLEDVPYVESVDE